MSHQFDFDIGFCPETSRKLALVSSSVSSPPSKSAPRRGRGLRRWVIIVAAILSTLLLYGVVRLQGQVTGQEFSPTHFQTRKFSFYEIPLLHIQITPIKRAGDTPRTATYIRQKSFIPKPQGPPTTWHLVTISRGMTGTTPGDAQLLYEQLILNTNSTDYWRQWSIDFPEHAKHLWPMIQRLATRELYILMPGLMELALLDQPAAEFASQADSWLREEYIRLIKDLREANRDELADELLDEALADYPGDSELAELKRTEPVQG